MRGKHNKLGEGERKVRLGQDSLPNIAISVAEMSRNYIRCFTRTPFMGVVLNFKPIKHNEISFNCTIFYQV